MPAGPGRRAAVAALAVFGLFLAATVGLQIARHAYTAELSGADEPAHFITALLIRDYALHGLPASPVAYAENYYLHYPKVAFGMWPPVFHATAAAWMLLLPATVASVRVLIAITTALAALFVFRLVKDDTGAPLATVIGLAFLALPHVQLVTQQVMVDSLVTALILAAALCWRRYAQTGDARDAVMFGLLGSAAMLTKGNGIALLGVPFAWALVAGRGDLLKRRATWIAVGLMLAIGGPWQVYTAGLLSRTVPQEESVVGFLSRADTYARYLPQAAGALVVVSAAIGAAALLARRIRERALPEAWSTPAALLLSILAFHIVLPQGPNVRYLVPALPVVLWLAVKGVGVLAARVPVRARLTATVALAVALATNVAMLAADFEPRTRHGIDAIADWILAQPPGVVLVSDGDSGINTSGMLIVEVAVRERRPGHVVLRGNKTLSSSTWNGRDRQMLQDTPQKVLAFLASVPVRYVVLDDGSSANLVEPANEMLRVAMRDSAAWRLAGTYPDATDPTHRRLVYASTVESAKPVDVSIDLGRTLGRTLTLRPEGP